MYIVRLRCELLRSAYAAAMQTHWKALILTLKQIGSMRRFIFCMMVATLFAACTQDYTRDLAPKTPMPEKIYASISTPEEFSRVHLDKNLKTVWDSSDVICVVMNSSVAFYQFIGTAGSSSGEFMKIQDQGSVPAVYDKPYAMYSDYVGLAKFQDGSPAPIMNILTEQQYMQGSYDARYSSPMLGQSETGDLNFEFKQMGGFLRFQLTGSKAVKYIKITSTDTLSGVFYTIMPPTQAAGNYAWYAEQANHITLECGDGVQLSNTPTDFYIVMAPGEYAAGIDMVVTFTDGTSFAKKSTNILKIEPNTIQPIKVINTDGSSDPIPSTEQHLTVTYNTPEAYLPIFTAGSQPVEGSINFDDGYTGTINSFVYYQFADTKASHSVSFVPKDATKVEFVNCHGITSIDFSNF